MRIRANLFMAVLFCFLSGLAFGENPQPIKSENEFFKVFQNDQFIDEKIDCLKNKVDNGLKEHFVKSLEKFKKPSFERLLKDYLDIKIPSSEREEIQNFLGLRRNAFEKMSPGAKKAYILLITDLSFLLSNIPDNDETGAKTDSYKNEIEIGECASVSPNLLNEKHPPKDQQNIDQNVSEKYSIGKMTVKTQDKEDHYIQFEIEITIDNFSKESFLEISNEIRRIAKNHLESITNHQAKVEFVDKVLHKLIKDSIENEIKKTKNPEGKVTKIFFPEFLAK